MQIVAEDNPKADRRNRTHSEEPAPDGTSEFVRRLVTTIKPRVIVENRSGTGFTIPLAQGLSENGFGKLVVYSRDPEKCAVLRKEIAAAGFMQSVSIDVRCESVPEAKSEGTIDLLLCSADHEALLRHLVAQINPVGLILLHATENEYEQVRQIALQLEKEGMLSVVTLQGSRRLVMAQKHAGRK
jgi:predicted O-methyltransferase YrrM